MVKTLGVIFIAMLVSMPIIIGAYITNSNFLYTFSTSQSLTIIATVLAINVAVITFLIGNLITLESMSKKVHFKNTRKELRANIYLMLVIFGINFLVVSINRSGNSIHLNQGRTIDTSFILSSVSVILVALLFIALLEIVNVIFSITSFITKE